VASEKVSLISGTFLSNVASPFPTGEAERTLFVAAEPLTEAITWPRATTTSFACDEHVRAGRMLAEKAAS